jgi:hypothetical protein
MKHMWFTMAMLGVVVILSSCSNSANPAAPDIVRAGQDFQNAIPIFTSTTVDPDVPPHFHDIAVCRIACAGDGIDYPGDYSCAAVTLHRQDDTPDHPFKPVFRWLDSGQISSV